MCVSAERDTPEVFIETDHAAHDREQTAEVQEDDGDWEQVGPRNKSMVTRMVRGFRGTAVFQLIPVTKYIIILLTVCIVLVENL